MHRLHHLEVLDIERQISGIAFVVVGNSYEKQF